MPHSEGKIEQNNEKYKKSTAIIYKKKKEMLKCNESHHKIPQHWTLNNIPEKCSSNI